MKDLELWQWNPTMVGPLHNQLIIQNRVLDPNTLQNGLPIMVGEVTLIEVGKAWIWAVSIKLVTGAYRTDHGFEEEQGTAKAAVAASIKATSEQRRAMTNKEQLI